MSCFAEWMSEYCLIAEKGILIDTEFVDWFILIICCLLLQDLLIHLFHGDSWKFETHHESSWPITAVVQVSQAVVKQVSLPKTNR